MESSQLGQKVRSAYLWTFAGTFVKQGLTFGLSMLLARLLSPADYGLIGIVLVVISYLSSFQDLGLGDAVIYFNDDDAALK
jgi:PST family polysaccharide transporter